MPVRYITQRPETLPPAVLIHIDDDDTGNVLILADVGNQTILLAHLDPRGRIHLMTLHERERQILIMAGFEFRETHSRLVVEYVDSFPTVTNTGPDFRTDMNPQPTRSVRVWCDSSTHGQTISIFAEVENTQIGLAILTDTGQLYLCHLNKQRRDILESVGYEFPGTNDRLHVMHY
jgi:hypothetical protein